MNGEATLVDAVEVLEDAQPRRFRPYPKYATAEAPWVGRLPSHWNTRPLKFAVRINPEDLSDQTDPDYELCYVDIGNVDYVQGILGTETYRFEDAPSRARRRVRHGDTIISTVRTYLKAVARIENPPENMIASTGFAVLRRRPDIDPGYLYRLVQCEEFIGRVVANSVGVSYPAIAPTVLGRCLVWLPPLDEQQAIAAFLDRETAKIDALVAKKRRLIELLKEKRTALISRAVTEGLNPDAPMKPSGIDWLGDVPVHWEVVRLKLVARIQSGLTLGKKYESESMIVCPYLRVANVQDGYLDLSEITEVQVPHDDVNRYELRAGDVLMTEGGDFDKLGRGYVWEDQIPRCLHQNHIFAVRPDPRRMNSHFLAALLTSSHGKNYFTSTSSQTTNLATTNRTKLGSFLLPLPPIEEQITIISSIDTETEAVDAITQAVGDVITRLMEYRSALISAAVTGKIDVRGEEESCQ